MPEYFQHDYACRNHPKMVALIGDHGAAGYGIFWAIAEFTHENEDHSIKHHYQYLAIAKQMATGVEHVLNIVEDCCTKYDLLTRNPDSSVSSKRTFENLGKREEVRNSKSKAGKASAEAKKARLDQHNSTGVEQASTDVQQESTKEKKGKENKEKEIFKETEILEVPVVSIITQSDQYEIPTLDQVKSYFRSKGETSDEMAIDFFSHYEGNGWKAGEARIAKWRPKADQWQRRAMDKLSQENESGSSKAPERPTFKQYNR